MSWKDILTGANFNTCDKKIGQIHVDVRNIGSIVAGVDSVTVGADTIGTDGKEPRPGARSNVPLRLYPFTPGSPVNDLMIDAWTVEKLNNCIVGHFLGTRMDYYDVIKEMFHQWERCGLEKMWCTDNEIYLFKFKVTNRIDEILEEAHCHVFGKVMVLKRWHQMQKLSKEAVFKVPIWVKIYELRFEFWLGDSLGENLSKIVSRIGRPLYMDTATEKGMRLSYARACVEIDVSDLLPNSINIEFGGESVEVKVQYQWVPKKYEKCGAFGHKGNYCPLNPKVEECGESKRAKVKAPTDYIYGGRPKGGNSGKVSGKDWKVVHKGIGENRVGSTNNSEVELKIYEGNKILSSGKHGEKAQVKGNLAKDKGHLKSGNSFAVLQSLKGENHGMNLNRGRKELDASGASRVGKTDGGNVAGGVDRDIYGEMIYKDSCSGRNPEEDIALFDVFATGRDAEGLGIVTPKPKKIWTENDFPVDWGNSKRRKAAKAANLAGPAQIDHP